ncbi:MAG: DUF58 domain-containing protein [Longimicrobiales bacterium]
MSRNSWRRRADPRLPGYLMAGLGAMIASIATGQHELAALGAPFLALAAIGLADRHPVETTGQVTLPHDLVIEDDVVSGQVSVDWEGEAEVEIMLAGWKGITPVEPAPNIRWSLPQRTGPATVPFELRAQSWGTHDLGALWVRVRRPGSLLFWERKLTAAPAIRVLPSPLRLQRLLRPSEPRAVSGMHLSRSRGHGTDFAELRPYQPGDRLRDLSWSTSARLGAPWVTVHHPERTGTVLLLLDAFFSNEQAGPESLARAARAAWAVASVHLGAQDRVGLLARGRTAAWVPPQGGLRARWLLMEALLSVGGAAEDVWRRRRGSRPIVPADALIVGVTTLRSDTFLQDLLHHCRTGHTVGTLVIDTADLMPDPKGPVDVVARRIWQANRSARRDSLERSGVSTALVTAEKGVGPAVSALRRRMRTRRRIHIGRGA